MTLYFGRDIPGRGVVTEAEWTLFAASVLGARFPEGFTVLDGTGQWRDPATGAISREATKIVQTVVAPDPNLEATVGLVVQAYIKKFDQKSVGVVSQAVCASFQLTSPGARAR